VPPGIYEITAKVSDKERNEYFSDPITIFVDPIEDGNLLINGEFTCSTKPWTLSSANGGNATFMLEVDSWLSEGNLATVEVIETGENAWDVMIYQPFSIIAGHEYEVTFVADALEKGEMIVSIQTEGGDWQAHIYETVEIDGPTEVGPITLTLDEDIPKAQFRLMVGGTSPNLFFFDNVKAIDKNWINTKVAEHDHKAITQFQLKQNYPNPFNPTTMIQYQISEKAPVTLSVYNIQGKLLETLVQTEQKTGHYTISSDGSDLASGIYYYKLVCGSQTLTRKMTLLQ